MRKNYFNFKPVVSLLFGAALLSAASVSGQTTQTYSYSGTIQQFTVPTCVYILSVTARGAEGGNGAGGIIPGKGAAISGVVSVVPGQVLKILVGQQPSGLNYGGGGSFLVTSSNSPLIVAGGGGGSSATGGVDNLATKDGQITTAGADGAGSGAGLGGTSGNGGGAGLAFAAGGGGGLLTNGTDGWSTGTGGMAFVNGGAGGTGGGGFGGGGTGSGIYVGGGGGGYSGGGGATNNGNGNGAVGGGGGSFNSGTNQINIAGSNSGNGLITISYFPVAPVPITPSNPVVCSGSSTTLTASGLLSYTWAPSGTFTGSNTAAVVLSPTINTTYTVSGTTSSGCTASTAITVTVSTASSSMTVNSSTASTCLGNTVSITATGALSYTFSGGISNGTAFTPPAGTNNYTVNGTNGCGVTTSVIPVSVSVLPVGSVATSTLICAGTPATLTANGATNYTWTPGTSTLTSYIVAPAALTVYTVTGKTGSCTGVSTITIATKPNPTLNISASQTAICYGDQVTLNVTGNAVTYTWTPGGPGASISAFPGNTTLYSVTGTNSVNCTSSAQQVIIVNPLPVVNATVSNPLVCSGGSSTLAASGASTYAWTGGSNATTSVMVVNPTADQTYTVVGTSSLGCSASTVVGVTIYSPTISVTSATSICSGATAVLNAGVADSYTWSNGQHNQNTSVNPTLTTTYTLTALVNNLNGLSCSATNTVQVSVNGNPTITIASNRSPICVGESAILTAEGAGAGGTYTYTGGAGAVVGATNTVSPIADQTYTVSGTDANSCKGRSTYNLVVAQCTGISLISANTANLSVYPNPSNGDFTISADQAITLQITNELGQQIRTIVLDKNTTTVKVNNLSNGIYFISGKNENGSVKQKIVIAK